MGEFLYEGYRISFNEYGTGNEVKILLLHGNTVSGAFFMPVIPKLSEKYHVITMDFLGNGQSERLTKWPDDLWFEWGKQAGALIRHLGYRAVNVIGCSGGALAALNLALECPELVNAVIADSFEGLNANVEITEQIKL
ncbi:MAG: alpha/beta hydrolase [Eubacteriales bacterium]|nr:alpha/beta hydrolase [Eubacteriales bacterium]